MVEIVPAILEKTFKDIERQAARVHGVAKKIQIDVVDGKFARRSFFSRKTWPYKDRKSFEKLVEDEHGLPFWEEVDYEFDLMIENPVEEALNFVRAGASHVIVHANAPGALEGLTKLADFKDDDDGAFRVTTGIALLPEMQPDVLEEFSALYDYVQVMGIARVGHQGEKFEPHSLALIERLRGRYPNLIIQVDGGVSLKTAKQFADAGANRLVVGSAIFNSDDAKAAYNALYTEVNGSE